jgi:hypothetical protein
VSSFIWVLLDLELGDEAKVKLGTTSDSALTLSGRSNFYTSYRCRKYRDHCGRFLASPYAA